MNNYNVGVCTDLGYYMAEPALTLEEAEKEFALVLNMQAPRVCNGHLTLFDTQIVRYAELVDLTQNKAIKSCMFKYNPNTNQYTKEGQQHV